MKNIKIIFIVMIILNLFDLKAQIPPDDLNYTGFTDHFDTPTLNPRWVIETGCQGKAPYYNDPANVVNDYTNSQLILSAKPLLLPYVCEGTTKYYSGSTVNSGTNTYGYGYYEVGCKFPSQPGFWCCWWINASHIVPEEPPCWYNEIDFIEPRTKSDRYLWSSNTHSLLDKTLCNWTTNDNVDNDNIYPNSIFDNHVYTTTWQPDYIKWFLDGNETPNRILANDNVIDIRKHQTLVLNNWIDPDSIPRIPNEQGDFIVDYVKVYELIMTDCDVNYSYTGNFSNYVWGVKNSITINNTSSVSSSSKVTLRASDYTLINGDFTVNLGGEFCIMPTACE